MQPHLPADCALAFAIPLRRAEFFAQLTSAGADREYVRLFRGQLGALSEDALWRQYDDRVAGPALQAARAIAQRGGRVIEQTTRSILRDALKQHPVVAVMAHWRVGKFAFGSSDEARAVLTQIEAGTRPVCRALAAVAPRSDSINGSDSLARVAAGLNESLRHRLIVSSDAPADDRWLSNDPDQLQDWNVSALREDFPHWPLVQAGMELADGVHPVNAIVDLVDPDYEGTLDLRMCHSVILGEAIKRAAPRARIVMNQRELTPSIQLPLYAQAVQMLETGQYDFSGAVAALHQALIKRLR